MRRRRQVDVVEQVLLHERAVAPRIVRAEAEELVEVERRRAARNRRGRRRSAARARDTAGSACGRSATRAPARAATQRARDVPASARARPAGVEDAHARHRSGLTKDDVTRSLHRLIGSMARVERLYAAAFAPPRASASASQTAPDRRFLVQDLDLAARRHLREPAPQLLGEPRHDAKDPAGQNERERRRRASRAATPPSAPRATARRPPARGSGVATASPWPRAPCTIGPERRDASSAAARGRRHRAAACDSSSSVEVREDSSVNRVSGPRPSAARTTAASAFRPIQ